jgi:two-component system nitrogen regulation response regulator NtrX
MSRILVIDDEAGVRNVLRDVLEDEGYQVALAEDGFKGLEILKDDNIDLVFLDVWLPNKGGIDVLKEIRESYPELETIVISGHANISLAVQAVKMGAFDFLEKPLSLERTITVVQNALKLEDLRKENQSLKDSIFLEDQMVGDSEPMKRVNDLIEQSARSDSRILITGENGTGKELVARLIHLKSNRRTGPFVEVNCAAIPETLIESELFGHEKGAFTNALTQRKGKFEIAHGGTLFLDEIADMSLSTQAKVLRVLQELSFERIGGEETLSVDIRVFAATNKGIEEEIQQKRFREDLYFRLNVIPIHVPPLRQRLEDLEELVGYFMQKFKHPAKKEPKRLTADAFEELSQYHWPGNIRELKNFVERVNIMVEAQEITKDAVRQYLGRRSNSEPARQLIGLGDMKLSEAKDRFEREFILTKLQENDNNISRTAQSLGIYPSNLHGKLKKFGITIERRP